MRWSDFSQRQCVDLMNGERLGHFCDLELDLYTGLIKSVYIPSKQSWFRRKKHDIKISWFMVQKVGSEMVIVDSDQKEQPVKSF